VKAKVGVGLLFHGLLAEPRSQRGDAFGYLDGLSTTLQGNGAGHMADVFRNMVHAAHLAAGTLGDIEEACFIRI